MVGCFECFRTCLPAIKYVPRPEQMQGCKSVSVEELTRLCNSKLCGLSDSGASVLYVGFGQLDMEFFASAGVTKQGVMDAVETALKSVREKAPKERYEVVLDLTHTSDVIFESTWWTDLVPRTVQLLKTQYPKVVSTIYVVGAPGGVQSTVRELFQTLRFRVVFLHGNCSHAVSSLRHAGLGCAADILKLNGNLGQKKAPERFEARCLPLCAVAPFVILLYAAICVAPPPPDSSFTLNLTFLWIDVVQNLIGGLFRSKNIWNYALWKLMGTNVQHPSACVIWLIFLIGVAFLLNNCHNRSFFVLVSVMLLSMFSMPPVYACIAFFLLLTFQQKVQPTEFPADQKDQQASYTPVETSKANWWPCLETIEYGAPHFKCTIPAAPAKVSTFESDHETLFKILINAIEAER